MSKLPEGFDKSVNSENGFEKKKKKKTKHNRNTKVSSEFTRLENLAWFLVGQEATKSRLIFSTNIFQPSSFLTN